MIRDPLSAVSTRQTPQSQAAVSTQIRNAAGGYVFAVDPMARLRRFLTLGTTGGTYYTSERELTKDSADALLELVRTSGVDVVTEILAISLAGRAPKQNPALFALALCAAADDQKTSRAAFRVLPQVARTATHLFIFTGYLEQFRGWGPATRKAVAGWYNDMSADNLAYQMLKYQSREGWSHADLIRLSHPYAQAPDDAHRALYNWARGHGENPFADALPGLVGTVEMARSLADAPDLADLIRAQHSLSWEMLPSEKLNDKAVWEALLETRVPLGALIRQLPRLTRLGLCDPMSRTAAQIAARLQDPTELKSARIHPVQALIAQRTYARGRSERGTGEWTPSRVIIDALDAAFYQAFGAIRPSGKRTLLALDISGSMSSTVAGLPISCREAAAAIALVTAASEPLYQIVGFSSRTGNWSNDSDNMLVELPISPRMRLDDVQRSVAGLPFGRTDCALPMLWALEKNLEVETFAIYTDNETWHGQIHPYQALQMYRQRTGINAKLVVCAMSATNFTIADPTDPGSLDVSGFDAATPQLVSDFAAGLI